MIKQIGKSNKVLSPFPAIREWNLFNIENDEGILIEPVGSPEEFVAMDYVDYSGNPLLNRDCNIALEQQISNLVHYSEGVSGSGYFNLNDAKNRDGTYKRLVYDQIEKAFYNHYRNPLQIFGMDNIDFPKSETIRNFGIRFLMFSIPRDIMGDRLVAGSIEMSDNNLDDNVSIYDDGMGNLIAGTELFSRVQEVRILGNLVLSGTASNNCTTYSGIPSPPTGLSAAIAGASVLVEWISGSTDHDYFVIDRSTDGITYTSSFATVPTASYYDYDVTGSTYYWYQIAAVNMYGTSSYSETASIQYL